MAGEENDRRARFAQLLAEHGAALGRLAFGYEADQSRRDELLQEIHLGMWRALPSFEGQASLRTWMFRVAHNIAVSHVRRASRRRDGDGDPFVEPTAEPPRSLDSDLDALRALERLRAAIDELSGLDRQIILLVLEELPQAEIAEITGLSTSNVSTRVGRIKQRLARHLEVGP